MHYEFKQSTVTYPLPFRLISAADETQPVLGATPTVSLLKSGQSAFSAGGGSVVELADGAYRYDWVAADLNTVGPMLVTITATGAVSVMGVVQIVSHDPKSMVSPAVPGRTLAVDATGAVTLSAADANTLASLLTMVTNIFSAFELDGLVYRLTANALEEIAGQNINATAVATAVWDASLTEPSGVPLSVTSAGNKLSYVLMMLMNKVEVTNSRKVFHNNAGTAAFAKPLSDIGVKYTEDKVEAP